jgi:hypothetical protein
VKDSRKGETLWSEWSGEDVPELANFSLIFYTIDHVDLENELVRRALASSLQRDGSADSLADGFRMIDSSTSLQVWGGEVDGEMTYTVCTKDGETREGDYVDTIVEITLVAM